MRAESRLKVLDENTARTTLSLLGNLIFHRKARGKRTRMVLPVKSASKKKLRINGNFELLEGPKHASGHQGSSNNHPIRRRAFVDPTLLPPAPSKDSGLTAERTQTRRNIHFKTMEYFLARWVGGNIIPSDRASSTIRVDLKIRVNERLPRCNLIRTILSSRRKISATNVISAPFLEMDLSYRLIIHNW